MRYFTKEMWAGWQEDPPRDPPTFDYSREWRQRVSRYFRQLGRLQGRVDAATFGFFQTVNLHDGRVVTMTVRDEVGARVKSGARPRRGVDPVSVTIEAVPCLSKGPAPHAYKLWYRGVSRLVVDYPSENTLFPTAFGGLGDWGYDELTSAGRQHLRHEILFASGGTVSIECKSITVRKRKGQRSRVWPHHSAAGTLRGGTREGRAP